MIGGSKLLIKPFGKERSQTVIKDIFAKLQISAHNPGVFNGRWGGRGPTVESIDPSTAQPLAKVATVWKACLSFLGHTGRAE